MYKSKLQGVLLIDDDKITNFINQRLIAKLEITDYIKIVNNGLEALNYFYSVLENKSKLPELILLDINMPVMDGFEFLDELCGLMPLLNVTILMLTTSNNEKDIEKISTISEIAGYINKPLTEEKLKNALEKYIDF